MFGFPDDALGHLTSSGTIANLEALWVARELHPGKAIAYGANAHYTHSRMCAVLGVEGRCRPTRGADRPRGRGALRGGGSARSSSPPGTTGLGTVDDVARRRRAARALRRADPRRRRLRRLLHAARRRRSSRVAPSARSPSADSVVVDPHKHGLQPYGCGAVLFRDPGVGRLYKHDSPYTYFTSGELHLGEISLECSRAGAAAAALWLTLRCLDLKPVLEAGVRAARRVGVAAARVRRAAPAHRARARHRRLLPAPWLAVGDRRRQRARARRRHGRPRTRSTCRRCGSSADAFPPRRRARRRRRPGPAQRADEARARAARALAARAGLRARAQRAR